MKPAFVLTVLVLTSLVLSQDSETLKGQPGMQESSVAAWKGNIRDTVERKGTFVPADATELKLDLKAYRGELRVVEIRPHGRFVNQGDVIARLETKGIDEQITTDKMALERSEMEMRFSEESARMKAAKDAEALEKTQIAADRAAKKLRGFREHEKKYSEESERLSIQWRKDSLEDQHDELAQLEKMYSEDELVDATEEIVLKRSRRRYARSVANQNLSEARRLYNKEWYESYREEDLERSAKTTAAGLARLRRTQEMGREREAADFKSKRYGLQKKREKFADLQRDKDQFVIRAPHRGILLHGAADAAPWPNRLEKGSTLRNRAVFATVAHPDKYEVTTSIPEEDVFRLKSGSAAEIVPTAAADQKMIGRLQIEYLPSGGGRGSSGVSFKATAHLGDKKSMGIRPGLSCTVRAIIKEQRDVVLVPKTALKKKGDSTVVLVAKSANGPFEERKVTTGMDDGKNIVIVDGVGVGEYVVPQAKKRPQRKP